jgi:glyoxylase-like metal-dependent hydrolase (beta-lactamase superfamily II)
MEVAPGIHRIQAPLGNRFVCVFALVGTDATIIVDSGLKDTPKSVVEPYFRENGLDFSKVRYVVITHADFDHNGGNGELKVLAPNALFLCHELDRAMIENIDVMIKERYNDWETDHGFASDAATDDWIRSQTSDVPMDMTLTGGERIRLSPEWIIQILHTAGHSWGHISLYDPRSKTAIIADAALYNSVLTADGQPAFPPTYRYLDTYQATIQRLLGMNIDTLLTSHYPLYRGPDAAEFLAESLAYIDRVDTALTDVLRGGQPMTLKEIIADIHKRLGNWPQGAEGFLNFPLTGHLEQMQQYKKVELGNRDGLITYRLASA